MSATQQRARVFQISTTDSVKALELARKIAEPLYRCQSLAHIARFASENDVVRIAQEAMSAALLGKDGYQVVTAASWPVRALVERKKITEANRAIQRILEISGQIEHPVCRADALVLFLQAVWPLRGYVREQVLNALLSACNEVISWRAGRIQCYLALLVAAEDVEKARQIASQMPEGIYKRRALRHLEEGRTGVVRDFF